MRSMHALCRARGEWGMTCRGRRVAMRSAGTGAGGVGELLCVAPPTHAVGEVEVHVTLNGAQYVALGATLRFRYLAPGMVFVSALSPPLGAMM